MSINCRPDEFDGRPTGFDEKSNDPAATTPPGPDTVILVSEFARTSPESHVPVADNVTCRPDSVVEMAEISVDGALEHADTSSGEPPPLNASTRLSPGSIFAFQISSPATRAMTITARLTATTTYGILLG